MMEQVCSKAISIFHGDKRHVTFATEKCFQRKKLRAADMTKGIKNPRYESVPPYEDVPNERHYSRGGSHAERGIY